MEIRRPRCYNTSYSFFRHTVNEEKEKPMTILTPILICLAVAAILGALWLFAPEAALQATISVCP